MKAVLDVNHHVIGIECAQLGIEAFFNENNIPYQTIDDVQNPCRVYQVFSNDSLLSFLTVSFRVLIFQWPFFVATFLHLMGTRLLWFVWFFQSFNRPLPAIDSIWDRGGLVAIDVVDRERFVSNLDFFWRISIYVHRYRDVLLRMMTPRHTRLYIVAMYHEDPEFTGLESYCTSIGWWYAILGPPNCLSDDHIAQLFGNKFSLSQTTFYLSCI